MLQQYKPKLYKKYRKVGYKLDSEIPEQHRRYDIVNNKVYLSENMRVGDLITVLWTKKRIALKSLDLSKLKKKNLERSLYNYTHLGN
ncbi:hypothetical protein TSAR_010382 [Trichomalopsis sarcophagae]|uniref:Uncharacterized protein n=1 Tax=Trichomalopsis sarcophagae TaxID=543379 RepID=A0A232EDV2_9HYME|nr:hypothetical protein TSAR_010382 [Trichomalopsis sarcophagae]